MIGSTEKRLNNNSETIIKQTMGGVQLTLTLQYLLLMNYILTLAKVCPELKKHTHDISISFFSFFLEVQKYVSLCLYSVFLADKAKPHLGYHHKGFKETKCTGCKGDRTHLVLYKNIQFRLITP